MALKYDKFNCFWAVAKKRLVKWFRQRYLCAQTLNEKSAFSPATVVFEK